MRIQHNILAMGAYRNYTANTSAMQKNLERLSSGYKINRAGDDAAGLAISEKMRAQITGLETASKNAKDGISLVQTAEGALTEVHDMLNRMIELATQSANGTFAGDTDRVQLQKEVDQLKAEINRIADSANFNGIQLLNGDMDTTTKVANAMDASLKGNVSNTGFAIISDGQLAEDPQAGVYQIDFKDFIGKVDDQDGNGFSVTVFGQKLDLSSYFSDKTDVTDETLASAIADKWNKEVKDNKFSTFFKGYGADFIISAAQKGTTVTFTMSQAPEKEWNTKAEITFANLTVNDNDKGTPQQFTNQGGDIKVKMLVEPIDSSSGRVYARAQLSIKTLIDKQKIKDGTTLTIGDTTYTFAVGRGSAYKNFEDVIDLTDLTQDTLGDYINKIAARITTAAQNNKNFEVTAEGALGNKGDGLIYLTEKEGGVDTENYKLEGNPNDGNDAADGTPANKDGDWTGFIKIGQADVSHMGSALTLQIGDTAETYNQLRVSIKDCHVKALGLSDVTIADQVSAQEAVDTIRDAINYVSDVRGTLGATQNRLDHTINNLSVMTENITDAESTIRDTDVAEEMMEYTKSNILIQAAQAMLAQANQIPQGVLQLLQ